MPTVVVLAQDVLNQQEFVQLAQQDLDLIIPLLAQVVQLELFQLEEQIFAKIVQHHVLLVIMLMDSVLHVQQDLDLTISLEPVLFVLTIHSQLEESTLVLTAHIVLAVNLLTVTV